tara:strand:+ start:1790 stop:2041 length:252 start_codon:yes stop_codon:yes gene_type:complete
MAAIDDAAAGSEMYNQKMQGSRNRPNIMLRKKSKSAAQSSETPIVDELTNVLKTWETKSYPNDKARWQEYTTDIANLITKYQG